MNKINQDKIEERDEATQQHHRDGDYNSRVTQFLVTAEPFFLWVPRPGSLLQLYLHFTEEVFDFGNHLSSKKRPTSNAQRPTRNWLSVNSKFSVRRSAFGVRRLPSLDPRQEGLEPPTDGFGDRYSTN